MEDGHVKIVSPIEDSPAFRAGIKAGDLITRIDDAAGQGPDARRGHQADARRAAHARSADHLPGAAPTAAGWSRSSARKSACRACKAKMVEPGYAWMRVSQFQERHGRRPRRQDRGALQAQDPNLKGLVLDLRNDPGGLLPSAVGVSAAFLPQNARDRLDQRPAARNRSAPSTAAPRLLRCAAAAPTRWRNCRPRSRRCRWWCW